MHLLESEIQKQIIEYLEMSGYLVFRMNAGKGRYNQRLCQKGTPDLLAIGNNKTVWIEVKTETGKLSEDQIEMHERLKSCGQKVYTVTSAAALKVILFC